MVVAVVLYSRAIVMTIRTWACWVLVLRVAVRLLFNVIVPNLWGCCE